MGSRKRDGPCLLPPLVTPVPSSPSLSRVGSAPNLHRSRWRTLGPNSPPGALAASWSCQLPPGSDSEAAAIVCAHLSHVNTCLRNSEPEKHERLEQAVKDASGNQYLRTITALRRNRSVSALERHALEAALASHMVKARTVLNDWKPAGQREVAAKRQPRSGRDTQASAAEATPSKRSSKEPRQASSRRAAQKGDAAERPAARQEGESPGPDASCSPGGIPAAMADEAQTGCADGHEVSPGVPAPAGPPGEELAAEQEPAVAPEAGGAGEVVEVHGAPEQAEVGDAATAGEREVAPESPASALSAARAEEGPTSDAVASSEAALEVAPAPVQEHPHTEGAEREADCPSVEAHTEACGDTGDGAAPAVAEASDPSPSPVASPSQQRPSEAGGEGLRSDGAADDVHEKAVPAGQAAATDVALTDETCEAGPADAGGACPDAPLAAGGPDVSAATVDARKDVHPAGGAEVADGGGGTPVAPAEDAPPAVPSGSPLEQAGDAAPDAAPATEDEQAPAAAAAVESHETVAREDAEDRIGLEDPCSPQSPPQSGFEEYSVDPLSPSAADPLSPSAAGGGEEDAFEADAADVASPSQARGAGHAVSFDPNPPELEAQAGREKDEEDEFEGGAESTPNIGQRDYTMSFEEDHGGQKSLAQRDYTMAFEADPEDDGEQDGHGDGYDDFGFECETPQNQGQKKLVKEEYEDEGDGFEEASDAGEQK